MTTKFDAFVAALEALCVEHKVHLCTSRYDALQAWNLKPGEPPLHSDFEDCTKVIREIEPRFVTVRRIDDPL